jgi:hypothetical protein
VPRYDNDAWPTPILTLGKRNLFRGLKVGRRYVVNYLKLRLFLLFAPRRRRAFNLYGVAQSAPGALADDLCAFWHYCGDEVDTEMRSSTAESFRRRAMAASKPAIGALGLVGAPPAVMLLVYAFALVACANTLGEGPNSDIQSSPEESAAAAPSAANDEPLTLALAKSWTPEQRMERLSQECFDICDDEAFKVLSHAAASAAERKRLKAFRVEREARARERAVAILRQLQRLEERGRAAPWREELVRSGECMGPARAAWDEVDGIGQQLSTLALTSPGVGYMRDATSMVRSCVAACMPPERRGCDSARDVLRQAAEQMKAEGM